MNQMLKKCNFETSNGYKNRKAVTNKEMAISWSESPDSRAKIVTIRREDIPAGTLSLHKIVAEEDSFEGDDRVGKTNEMSYRPSGLGKVSDRTTQDIEDATVQGFFENTVSPLRGSSRVLCQNSPLSTPYVHETKKMDITAARATFPEFFPRGPVQDSYDCLLLRPTLEDIFSGRTSCQRNLCDSGQHII